MTTAAAVPEPVFVDTNVLIYAAVPAFPMHAAAIAQLDALRQSNVDLWISRQVLREYLSALSRPQTYTPPIPQVDLIADVTRFQSDFLVAEDGPAVTTLLLSLLATIPCGGKQVYDANIVATMQAHGLRLILTHNTADFARFAAHVTVLPL